MPRVEAERLAKAESKDQASIQELRMAARLLDECQRAGLSWPTRVVMDDNSELLWTLEEIARGVAKGGRPLADGY